jgi:signal transduction histidine kinase/ActR/RegA family two-component response regulator
VTASVERLRTVLVDDTPDIRLLLRAALEGSGRFTVVAEAGDGAAGVRAVGAAQPDVVLLDLAMPLLDGLEALPLIRAAAPGARVVVLSGFESATMRRRAHAAGAHVYLQKGINPFDVVDQVLRMVGSPSAGVPPSAPSQPSPAAPELLATAPFGVLLLRLDADGQAVIVSANPSAAELLGADVVARGDLAASCPPLAAAVAAHRAALHDELRAELDLAWRGRRLRATLVGLPPAAGRSRAVVRDEIAAYLAPASEGGDDVAWLRSAVAGAAHEIRNPTVVIAGAAAALSQARGRLPDAVRDDLLAAVARQARLLDRATGDLLTAAQAHRGSLRVDSHPVDLAPLLQAAAGDAPCTGVAVQCPPGLVALADPLRLQQMVLNLLANAAKYGSPPVIVEGTADGDVVVVGVRDHGPGVPAEFVSALFGEFSRAPGTSAPGIGLGLFVVRSLAEAQGGAAWYEAAADGGPRFVFALPRGEPQFGVGDEEIPGEAE